MADKPRLKNNKDVACFFLTKHSWKGKFRRIFSVGSAGVSTYNPSSMEATNQWLYEDFMGIAPAAKGGSPHEFTILVRKGGGRKTETMRFSSEHRAELITETLRFRAGFGEPQEEAFRCNAFKHHWSESRQPAVLEAGPCSLDQLDAATGAVVASYHYKDVEAVAPVSDYPGGFVVICGRFGRMHLFASEKRDMILRLMADKAQRCVGVAVSVRKEPITLGYFTEHRLGHYSADEHLTSMAEFSVHKTSPRHREPVRRTLCLSETCLLERDPASYAVCTLRPLSHVFALVRHQDSGQTFAVEYNDGQVRGYLSTDRDSLLASLLDSVRAAGNVDVHVRSTPTPRGHRLAPLFTAVEQEVESMHLKLLHQPPPSWSVSEAVARFNANVSYSGLIHAVTGESLFAENKERLISAALTSLLQREGDQTAQPAAVVEAQFHALRRLVASKAGFAAFTQLAGFREQIGLKVVRALKRDSDAVTHAALDMLAALLQPMHADYDLKQEQLNKTSLLSSKVFLEKLLDVWSAHVRQGTGALVVSAFLDFLTYGLCAPYSETTDGAQFDSLLELVAGRGRALFRLFLHPSLAIVKGAGLVMRAIIGEGDAATAERMQDLALAEGALPRHLHTALFTQSADGRLLTHRQLSRQLITLWCTGHQTASDLLARTVPPGLLSFLDSDEAVPADDVERLNTRDNLQLANEQTGRPLNPHLRAINQQLRSAEKFVEKHVEVALQHWRTRMGYEKTAEERVRERPVVLRRRRERVKSEKNWRLFYYQFGRDHALPHLIWNFKTREELREALENEMRNFGTDRDLGGGVDISWNHTEFEVQYHCLQEEIQIGDYYLRLLLEQDEANQLDQAPIRKSFEFFNDLYHRFLLTPKVPMKCMCLQAMAIVYGRHHAEIGHFGDTKYIVSMLERCTDRAERDRLILFISKLILHQRNVKDVLDAGGVKVLADLVTLSHLHTTRAYVPTQSNVIEYGESDADVGEREWYFKAADADKQDRQGPYSFKEMRAFWEDGTLTARSRCWAQGMDGWRSLQAVPQLRWTLCATGQAVLNETDMAVTILNIFITMCHYYPSRDARGSVIRPLPRVKRLLSDPGCLPHIVQLLLTFDPILVEKVATLLTDVVRDNPVLSKMYLTGVYFFILMYTGSNVLPIAKFLQLTHISQAFRSEESGSDLMQRSVLGQLVPEAMVCYLHNYGAEKFAHIYLGEFDTPEVIWNNEMRKMMIGRIAAHLADFSPRLRSNTRAIYQYCPMPHVTYPQLERELFCSIFYLRHLCDTAKFPDWPIKDPVALLKDVLLAWKREVEKKPPSMSVDEALAVLGLEPGRAHEQNNVRKAYFRLAQKYHPDKNPDGRDKFEDVNRAYEFLCSRSARTVDGPDPHNIVLILRAQSILFSRYGDELRPYKYAGYPMLVTTIRMETEDDQLFSKSAPLLAAATEVAYYTVRCSALNAEELRRERGLELLQSAYSRCCSVLSKSSRPDDVAVQVCSHVSRCYTVAAQFQQCRDKLIEMPQIIQDLCRILYYKRLTRLCVIGVECVSAFAADSILQLHMMQAGVLWHLLLFLFYYDFTLDEGGVEKTESTNQQEAANTLAKKSLLALARLSGYLTGDDETPPNRAIDAALQAMLTPHVVHLLRQYKMNEVLKLLNSNTENPYIIWDNSTRSELREFLKEQQTSKIRTGESDPNFGAEFCFSAHKDELVVGNVFVRIYNQQPSFALENPKGLAIDLLDFIGSLTQYLHSLQSLAAAPADASDAGGSKVKHAEMALEALANVIQNNPGVEFQCIGHFGLLFGLLRLEGMTGVQQRTLNVITCVTGNQECVSDIAASEVVTSLLLLLHTLPAALPQTLDTLHALMSNTKIVKEGMNRGAVIYLLDLFCNATHPDVRNKTAELLAKMLSDKLVGPKVRLTLLRFLPPLYMDAMRDSPESSVHMFESVQENPELIWNDEAREKICDTVRRLKVAFYQKQRSDPNAAWKLPDDFSVQFTNVQGEVVVGGVFLRLFIANPGWVLRRPKEFLTELLDTGLTLMQQAPPDTDTLEMVATATVQLLHAQPALLDAVPAQGHIPRLFKAMTARNDGVLRACLLIVHQLADNEACSRSIGQADCISPLVHAMRTRRDMVGVACDTLYRLFSRDHEPLVQQALDARLVQYLLTLLDGRLESENPAAVKAQIVKALKAMTRSLQHGEQVSAILNRSQVWPEYRDQKHDLFITSTPTAGYLTGAAPGVAGYLTSGNAKLMPDAPPDVDHDESLNTSGGLL
ncbi:dnaJ homolog subfamily C member 13-like isoform X2 [Pollicipes pollicipes]|uniref:dnaJ homolog subfamily C member 13-like isoform X2 n=1 Tax=Pollicipes pollicipes TaxID=41117 RepID=UPI0018858B28|nr:dnaJ homolog subfamily C member 13-like isoform X2 [Pollicipes pollicipes]